MGFFRPLGMSAILPRRPGCYVSPCSALGSNLLPFMFLDSQWQLGMDSGALIAVPIPEEYSEKGEAIQKAVNQAVLESEENGMSKRGKDVTPWLLSRVAELTKHDSIDSNIALLRNTALIGSSVSPLWLAPF